MWCDGALMYDALPSPVLPGSGYWVFHNIRWCSQPGSTELPWRTFSDILLPIVVYDASDAQGQEQRLHQPLQTFPYLLERMYMADTLLLQASVLLREAEKEGMLLGGQMGELAHTARGAGDTKFGKSGQCCLVHHQRNDVRK